ncbi:MAG: hypothetical protein OXH16_13095 [Gemmatimonadetes bacterium]|nr:hypothetical protein [Gemmatimonadota bacterium]
MDILKSYLHCTHLNCQLPPVERGLCGYHLTNPPEDESHYSVYRITLADGRAFVEATEVRIADRIKEHTRTPNSPIAQGIKPGAVWRAECLDTGLSRGQAVSLEWKEKARIERQTKRPVGQPRTDNLKLVSVRIPLPLLALIEKAKSNSHDSRNQVICKVLEQYFTGELMRVDDTALDYLDAIDFEAPMVRRALPLTS